MSIKQTTARLFCLALLLYSPTVLATNTLAKTAYLACKNTDTFVLQCDYHLPISERTLEITASYHHTPLPVGPTQTYPWPEATTAILFLVDTSDPARQATIEQKKRHIEKMLSTLQAHQLIGLASFDKQLKVHAPLGSSRPKLLHALDSLAAKGQTTELYKNSLQAIRILATTKADRKVLILLSDGLAEDIAYHHHDVIEEALRAKASIYSIGYPRSIPLSVGLQSLQRLSEETYGHYIETDRNHALPGTALTTLLNRSDNGGRLTIELGALKQATELSEHQIDLVLHSEHYTIRGTIPLAFPTPIIQSFDRIIGDIVIRTDQETSPAQLGNKPIEQIRGKASLLGQHLQNKLWLFIIICLLAMILITILLLRHRKRPEKKPRDAKASKHTPYGYLIENNDKKTSHPISKPIWRIGRGKENELVLQDNSVSRRHAELHYRHSGVFNIIDLSSANGVYVNSKKISGHHLLSEGDHIEIGDLHFHFIATLTGNNNVDEKTIIQQTRTPL